MRKTEEWNLCDPKAIDAFVRRYGVLDARLDSWCPSSSVKFDESSATFSGFQEILCNAWKQEIGALAQIEIQVVDALEARTSMNAGTIELITENLWSFICVLFMRDFQEGKAKVCISPDCIHPYFIEQRKGQKYCSHVCAVRENVRRFRQAESDAKHGRTTLKRERRSKRGAIKTR